MVAEISKKKVGTVEDIVAIIRCSKIEGKVPDKLAYVGHGSCTAANLAFGGPAACQYACIGLGDCVQSCPFDAITMKDNFPTVDAEHCVGCGTCVRSCPKSIIELLPLKARVRVPCSTKDPGKTVRQICETGCIACKMCVKVCPAKVVSLEDNIVQIDHQKCLDYGPACEEICVEKCPRDIFRHYPTTKEAKLRIETAAA